MTRKFAIVVPRDLKAVLIVALLIAALLALRVQYQLGRFVTLGPSTPSQIRLIRDETGLPLVGAEDFAIDHTTRRVYFSVYDVRAAFAGRSARGHLYMLSLDDPALMAHNITPAGPNEFHPHGLDLLRDADGHVSLYVVNLVDDPAIEIFDIATDGRKARHRETITTPNFIALNAITVVGPRRFYVTNEEGARSALRLKLNSMLHIPESSIVYFDGAAATSVAKGLNHSSGLVASRNGTEIYVAEGYSWRIKVFHRNPTNGSLTLTRIIPLGTAPDNLEVDVDNNIWVGAHPQPYKLYAFASDPNRPSPSQIVRVDLDKPDAEAAQVEFQDDGTRINSSTAGSRIGSFLVVSSIFGSPAVVSTEHMK